MYQTEKEIETLKSDVEQLKVAAPSLTTTGTVQNIMTEIKEREDRSKNIIIIGIPEPTSENTDDRRQVDKTEVLKITKTVNAECPEPVNIFRLGKYNSDKRRPIKVCFNSQVPVMSILRNRNNMKSDTIKLYSDQTLQQQAYMRNLKEELKQRVNDGDKSLCIKYIKGTPKITSLPPKN
ncbi:Uncharacterized protein OBRU01_17663 [Operophtera brumata]|uniref:Endonuclease-reverse transcriptase n=1 Tax=Operophtera brumata TaxID=104452 RepID=A0A0L7L0E5_OPEBR|nr:Uncharacterized protein OBRU01_17663 [Operophtera brumata]